MDELIRIHVRSRTGYDGGDALMSFAMMVRANDDNTCNTDTRSNTQVSICSREGKCLKFSFEFMSLHKVIVYLARQRCHTYIDIGGQ